ncbi:MAG TPA: hypothetical protein VN285_02815, partial [Candidatus Deferrimicrobium sp.]|nr:hypothetical protein [Candidatus Deferrimicrobium sp.]
ACSSSKEEFFKFKGLDAAYRKILDGVESKFDDDVLGIAEPLSYELYHIGENIWEGKEHNQESLSEEIVNAIHGSIDVLPELTWIAIAPIERRFRPLPEHVAFGPFHIINPSEQSVWQPGSPHCWAKVFVEHLCEINPEHKDHIRAREGHFVEFIDRQMQKVLLDERNPVIMVKLKRGDRQANERLASDLLRAGYSLLNFLLLIYDCYKPHRLLSEQVTEYKYFDISRAVIVEIQFGKEMDSFLSRLESIYEDRNEPELDWSAFRDVWKQYGQQ